MSALDTFKATLQALFASNPATRDAAANGIADAVATYHGAVGSTGGIFPKAIIPTGLTAADMADVTKFDATGLGVGAYLGTAWCNGNNGTPDLRGRFLVGGSGGGGGFNAATAHTHNIDHTHGAKTSDTPSANNTGAPTTTVTEGPSLDSTGGSTAANTGITTLTTSQIPAHSHPYVANIQHSDGAIVSGEAMTTGLQVGGRRRYSDATDNAGGGTGHSHTLTHSHSLSAHTHGLNSHVHSPGLHTHSTTIGALGTTASGPASASEIRPASFDVVYLMTL